MSLIGEQVLLRVYLEHADRVPFGSTFERVIEAARRHGLAGATALKGILGASARRVLRPSAWSLAEHAPVVVEVVDGPQRIVDFACGPLAGLMSAGGTA